MSIITNVKSPQQMSSNLADHRVGGCVDEGVLLWAPEVRGVGGLTNEKRVFRELTNQRCKLIIDGVAFKVESDIKLRVIIFSF